MRTLFVQLLSFSITIGLATTVYNQGSKPPAKPDLSGTWAFDRNRSNVGPGSTANNQIKISHHDPELKIVRTSSVNGQPERRELTYYTDARGETNPATIWLSTSPSGKSPHPSETISNTKWSGGRVVTRTTLRLMVGIHAIEEEVVDEWQLSTDGKPLTQTTRHLLPVNGSPGLITVPANRPDDKRVYTLLSK